MGTFWPLLGWLGGPARGWPVVEDMRRQIEAVRERVVAARMPLLRVFCEEWGKPVIASQGWVLELVEAVGGEFVGQPGKQVTPEEVRAADPDVLVAAWCGAGERVPLEKIVAQRGWGDLRAVREGRVFCIADEFLNTPAPTLLQGLRALATALHPSLFPENLVPRAIRADALVLPVQEKFS